MAEGGRHLRPSQNDQPPRQTRRPAPQEQPRRPVRQEPAWDEWEQDQPAPRRTRPVQPSQPPRQARPDPRQGDMRQPAPRRTRPVQDEPPRPRRVAVEPPSYRRRRGISKQSIPLLILVAVLVGGMLFAGGKLIGIMLDYRRDRTAYDELAGEAISALAEPDVTTAPDATPAPSDQPGATVSELPIKVDWELLRQKNSDIVGWIYDPGGMSYPVMQTSDNKFYLDKGWDKEPNVAGCLFADTAAAEGVLYSNYLIYGHNMKDGSMFASIMKYVDQSYYDLHKTMYYLTPWQNYRVELIAAHIVESTLNNFPNYFGSDSEYQQYLNEITSRSFFRTTAQVTTERQLITLSTCDYSSGYNDPRFLLHGMLVPVQ